MGFKGHSLINLTKEELENDMIDKFIKLKEYLNKTPTSRDVVKYSKLNQCYSMTAYKEHFQSLYNLQKICNFIPSRIGRNINKEEMISLLKKLGVELNRTPTKHDLKDFSWLPSVSHYERVFGNFINALKESGFTDIKFKTILTNKGTKCFSYFEYKFIKMLENYNIDFNKEVYYKEFIMNFSKKYRFDVVVNFNNQLYFVEIFGIIKNQKYDIRKNEKINICKNNNIHLIIFEPNDLWGTTNEFIYNLFKKKMQEAKDKYEI